MNNPEKLSFSPPLPEKDMPLPELGNETASPEGPEEDTLLPEEDTEINEENLAERVIAKIQEIKKKYGEKIIKTCQRGAYGLELTAIATAIGTNAMILKRFADRMVIEHYGEIFTAGPSHAARVAIVITALSSLAVSTTIGPALISYFNKERRELDTSI